MKYGVPDIFIKRFDIKKEADVFVYKLLSTVKPEEDIEKIDNFYKENIMKAKYYDKILE